MQSGSPDPVDRPALPVNVPGELPRPWRERHEERQERRRQQLFAILAVFSGGFVGFPLLLLVARLLDWAPRDIPGIAGAIAWVVGSAGVYGLLRGWTSEDAPAD